MSSTSDPRPLNVPQWLSSLLGSPTPERSDTVDEQETSPAHPSPEDAPQPNDPQACDDDDSSVEYANSLALRDEDANSGLGDSVLGDSGLGDGDNRFVDTPANSQSFVSGEIDRSEQSTYFGSAGSESLIQRLADRLRDQYKMPPEARAIVSKCLREILDESENLEWSLIDFEAGSVLGRYRIDAKLGGGGSGRVYAAMDLERKQPVALKTLRSADGYERFRREMELVQKLAHPHIVTTFDVGRIGDMSYIAMEKMAGGDLRQEVLRNGPLGFMEAAFIIRSIARALNQAHQRGIIHRDIKPGNLLRAADKTVKLTDFGLAIGDQGETDEPTDHFHTQLTAMGGTPAYMSPEQARCLSSADEQSDIYSLGVTWYFLLTGHSFIPGETPQERLANLFAGKRNAAPADALLPSPLDQLWHSMVQPNRQDRPTRVDAVANVIERWGKRRLAEQAGHETDDDSPQSDSPPSDSIADSTLRILLVEDDESDLMLTIAALERCNRSLAVTQAR
ncbi:MAG: serine/threonine-protein kinase, partial [Planctomycetota bacterium]